MEGFGGSIHFRRQEECPFGRGGQAVSGGLLKEELSIQAELVVRKAPMETDILVSHSSALFPDPPLTNSSRINLSASKHQGAHHLPCLHGEETQELPFTSLAHDYHVLTYRHGLTYIRAYICGSNTRIYADLL